MYYKRMNLMNLLPVALILGTMCACPARADVTVGPLFTDGMVVQQNAPFRIWGKASPGEAVTVTFAGKPVKTMANGAGYWEMSLPTPKAGGPYTLQINGTNALTVKDVLVGEVWVCSGQSNMEWNMAWLNTPEGGADIVASEDNGLRMFTVPKTVSYTPLTEVPGGKWQAASRTTTGGFSSVAYYFGRALRKARNVPIGLIHTSWGGTPIEAWTSQGVLTRQGMPASRFLPPDPNTPEFKAAVAQWEARVKEWEAAGKPEGEFVDPGIGANAVDWQAVTLKDASGWKPVAVPGMWGTSGAAELTHMDGGVWLRYTFNVPANAVSEGTLSLGPIDDMDTTWVNGVQVGKTGPETPNYYSHPRQYPVPKGVIKPGPNTIAVRVWDGQGGGGMTGSPSQLFLQLGNGTKIPLSGNWLYKAENVRPANPGAKPGAASNPNAPSVLYNAMFKPLSRYSVAGGLWYQGESNAGNPTGYRTQLPDMISLWRRDWNRGDLPFFVVQLAPFMAIKPEPSESSWAGLREAQSYTAQTVPNTGVAVITDVGDVQDIHPRRKAPVGERLALLAREIAYKEKITGRSPQFANVKLDGNKARVYFHHVGDGLTAQGMDSNGKPVAAGKVVGFAVAGSDGKFVWADVAVTGKNEVTLTAPSGVTIQQVRFGWADFPVVNLTSKAGLPVDPFRTDAPAPALK